MSKRTHIYRPEDIPRNGGHGEVTTYKLSPEEIHERYGHIKPYVKEKTYIVTAKQSRPIMFKTGGVNL